MDAKSRRLLLLVAIAVVAAIGVWWAMASRDRVVSEDDTTAPADGAKPPRPLDAAPPPLAGRIPDKRDATPAADASASPAAAAQPATFRVRGHVRGLEPSVPPASLLYVASVRSPRLYLSRTPLAANGQFDVEVEAPDTKGPWRIEVGAWGDGFARVSREADASPGDVIDIELEAAKGATLSGRLLDDDGKGAPGVRFVLVEGGSSHDRPGPDGDAQLDGFDGNARARALTDGWGGFVVGGVPKGGLEPVSLDPSIVIVVDGFPSWIIVEERDRNVTLRAHAALRLDVHVTRSGVPIGQPTRGFSYWLVGGASDGASSGSPAWTHWERAPSGPVESDLLVSSPGYGTVERHLRFEPGRWTQSIDVTLEALTAAEQGRVLVDFGIRTADGRRPALRITTFTTKGSYTSGHDAWATLLDDGRTAVTLPAGEVTLSAEPDGPFGALLSWRGVVAVVGGGDVELVARPPAHGLVVLRTPASTYAKARVSLTREPKATAWASMGWNETSSPALDLPVGVWTTEVKFGNESWSGSFEILDGVKTVVGLVREK